MGTHSDYRIDWEKTIALNANNVELAREILLMFADELPQCKEDIEKYWENKDLKNLSRVMHKLRGSCCYCSAGALGKLAAEIEITLVDRNETPEEATIKACLGEITAIIHELKTRDLATIEH